MEKEKRRDLGPGGDVLFFLRWGKGDNDLYEHLEESILPWDIESIPLFPEQVAEVAKNQKKILLVVITRNNEDKRRFQRSYNSIFLPLLRVRKLTLFHLSSYPDDVTPNLWARSRKHYAHYQLPKTWSSIIKELVAKTFLIQKEEDEGAWLYGGRPSYLQSVFGQGGRR